ncbi:MAG TPA: FAD-dependent oxidoreductase [Roseiarcus sp.]|nr:FAD-dependent oxidoreductase [Roseiarcus sp.]
MSDLPGGGSLPLKVAILGGGPAGLAAAYWLTAPEQQNRFEATLYTQGWRLGGKCASGRNPGRNNRIEEHGLHMLMGCYQNAFATLRSCYAEWKRPETCPFQHWQNAFWPQRQVTLMEEDGPGGDWSPWNFPNLPRFPGEPGDDLFAPRPPLNDPDTVRVDEVGQLVLKMSDWLESFIHIFDRIHPLRDAIEALRAAILSGDAVSVPIHAARLKAANAAVRDTIRSPVVELALRLASAEPDVRRLLILANLGIAVGLGYLVDLLGRGDEAYDRLNQLDFREWLSLHGACDEALASAPIRALYDLTFAFKDGNAGSINNGSIAAGVSLRFIIEVTFGYRDAPLWKMATGMGDTVFTPFYQVLEARRPGTVQFFYRLADLRPGPDGRIAEIELLRQAETVDGRPYDPFLPIPLLGLDCWPNQPNWNQLKNGDKLKADHVNFEAGYCNVSVGSRILELGQDFDVVILAVPPAAIAHTTQSWVQGSAAWQNALLNVKSVATQSLQVWMQPTVKELGWSLGPTVMTAFAEDYDSWGDMSHVLWSESWSGPNTPHSVGYFCGVMAIPPGTPRDPAVMKQVATENADAWMQADLATLWPATRANLMCDRHLVANFDGSDLYVQTPSGTNVESRFSPAKPAGYSNLLVVGDWTRTRFSGGCFESAIESGMLASRALGGIPANIKTR